MIEIENFKFPETYLFYLLDPNGGLWLIPDESTDNRHESGSTTGKYVMGVSSLIAEKLEQIHTLALFTDGGEIKMGEVFLRLSGPKYEMEFFAPFDCKNVLLNPKLSKKPILTQENVYNELWILKAQVSIFTGEKWVHPDSPVFSRFVLGILKADKKLREKCCPDFKQSTIVRRQKQ